MKYLVQIHEYERGWGNRLEIERLFDTPDEAKKYAREYNKANNEDIVPDVYWSASYWGEVSDDYECK